MSTAIAEKMERVLVAGDLKSLSEAERVTYYQKVCQSVGLNHLTQPFEFITLNGKLTLYARKAATDQLRKVHGVSIDKPEIQFADDWIIVTVTARDSTGRTDSDVGVVNKKDMRGDYGNSLMKAVTKAKRRVTLSICGLGMLDETEVETIPGVRVNHDGPKALAEGEVATEEQPDKAVVDECWTLLHECTNQDELKDVGRKIAAKRTPDKDGKSALTQAGYEHLNAEWNRLKRVLPKTKTVEERELVGAGKGMEATGEIPY